MNISNTSVEYRCPTCGSRFEFRLSQAASGELVRCPQGHQIRLKSDAKFRKQLRDGDRSVKQLEAVLKRFR